MAILKDMPKSLSDLVMIVDIPEYTESPWTDSVVAKDQRIALISTAGLQRRDDRPFEFDSDDYRIIPDNVDPADIVMSHISSDFDRSGFQQDFNVVFPLGPLREMAAAGEIRSSATYHYSFMGGTHPDDMAERAQHLIGLLKKDGVTGVVLAPV